MKRFLIEVPDSYADRIDELIDTDVVLGCREFTTDRLQKDIPLTQLSALQDERIDDVPDDVPDESEVLAQCSALSKQLALFGKKKPISQRK